jgi:hypothetical protein
MKKVKINKVVYFLHYESDEYYLVSKSINSGMFCVLKPKKQ